MKLSEVAEIRMGYPFRSRLEHDPAGDLHVVQMKDIDAADRVQVERTARVSLSGASSHHFLRKGDLLFRSRGRTNGAAIVTEATEAAVVAAPILRIRPRAVLPEFLFWFLNSSLARAQLAGLAAGTSVRMVSAEAVRGLELPLPPLADQRRIAEVAFLAGRELWLMTEIAAKRNLVITHTLIQRARSASRKANV